MADTATASVTTLLDVLDVEDLGADRFRAAATPTTFPHLFGGQVLAQALVAAARTLGEPGPANSLHAYFLRPGDPGRPVEFEVGRVRDGRRLSCRSVSALQGGKPIATVLISFAQTTGSVRHQKPLPTGPPPEQLPDLVDAAAAWGGLGSAWTSFEAFDFRVDPRRVDRSAGGAPDAADSAEFIWERVAAPLPDDAVVQQAVLVYMSDIMLLAAALVPHGVAIGQEEAYSLEGWGGVSLDHAIWFHQPVRCEEWLLFAQHSPIAEAGRCLAHSDVFTADGVLVATIAQEGLIYDMDLGKD
jgi:acyl-CoA thioesterase-2